VSACDGKCEALIVLDRIAENFFHVNMDYNDDVILGTDRERKGLWLVPRARSGRDS
jgi:hypothetical protein